MNTKQIVKKYLIIIASVFLIFLIGRISYDLSHQKKMKNEELNESYTSINSLFVNSKDLLIKNYTLLTQHFMNSKTVYEYLKNDKREDLYKLLKKDYEDFKKIDSYLFVMHFFNTKNITILRMHKPNSYHDDLSKKRPIVAYTNKALKPQNAFEVGKNGIVYRITTPFIHKDQHVGILEFGVKLDYFTHILEKQLNVKSMQLVQTESLDVLLAKKNYQSLGKYSIVSKDSIYNNIIDKIDITKQKQYIYTKNKSYMLFTIDMEDYNGKVIAKLYALKDITLITEKDNNWFYLVNASSVLVYIIVLIIMGIVLSKFALEIKHNARTIKKLHNHSKILHTRANTDFLTGVYNKRYFNRYLEDNIKNHIKGALIMFDIDHFKKINDTYGHLVGDEILKGLAKHIQGKLRENDMFARWGGEEFVILLDQSNIKQATQKAEHLRQSIEETLLYEDIKITISLGVSDIDENSTKETVIKKTDKLLYEAKENGRNCVMF